MRGRKKRTTACCLLLMGLLWLCGCSSPSSDSGKSASAESEAGLVYESSMELQYAENFSNYYDGDDDYEKYYNQACEEDARDYVEEGVEDYMRKIEEYKNNIREYKQNLETIID